MIAVYLRSNTQQHSNSSTGGSPQVFLQMLEREGAASLFGLKRRNYFLKDTFSKALI